MVRDDESSFSRSSSYSSRSGSSSYSSRSRSSSYSSRSRSSSYSSRRSRSLSSRGRGRRRVDYGALRFALASRDADGALEAAAECVRDSRGFGPRHKDMEELLSLCWRRGKLVETIRFLRSRPRIRSRRHRLMRVSRLYSILSPLFASVDEDAIGDFVDAATSLTALDDYPKRLAETEQTDTEDELGRERATYLRRSHDDSLVKVSRRVSKAILESRKALRPALETKSTSIRLRRAPPSDREKSDLLCCERLEEEDASCNVGDLVVLRKAVADSDETRLVEEQKETEMKHHEQMVLYHAHQNQQLEAAHSARRIQIEEWLASFPSASDDDKRQRRDELEATLAQEKKDLEDQQRIEAQQRQDYALSLDKKLEQLRNRQASTTTSTNSDDVIVLAECVRVRPQLTIRCIGANNFAAWGRGDSTQSAIDLRRAWLSNRGKSRGEARTPTTRVPQHSPIIDAAVTLEAVDAMLEPEDQKWRLNVVKNNDVPFERACNAICVAVSAAASEKHDRRPWWFPHSAIARILLLDESAPSESVEPTYTKQHDVGTTSNLTSSLLLDDSQKKAVVGAIEEAAPMTLISGVAQTGKTTVAAQIISRWATDSYRRDERGGRPEGFDPTMPQILAVAQSDDAVDKLLEMLLRDRVRAARACGTARNDELSRDHCVESAAARAAEESRSRGDDETAAVQEATQNMLRRVDVVVATVEGAGARYLRRSRFRCVLVDDAARASELALLMLAAQGCRQMVLISDQNTTEPSDSLFGRLAKQKPAFRAISIVSLTTQYTGETGITRDHRSSPSAHSTSASNEEGQEERAEAVRCGEAVDEAERNAESERSLLERAKGEARDLDIERSEARKRAEHAEAAFAAERAASEEAERKYADCVEQVSKLQERVRLAEEKADSQRARLEDVRRAVAPSPQPPQAREQPHQRKNETFSPARKVETAESASMAASRKLAEMEANVQRQLAALEQTAKVATTKPRERSTFSERRDRSRSPPRQSRDVVEAPRRAMEIDHRRERQPKKKKKHSSPKRRRRDDSRSSSRSASREGRRHEKKHKKKRHRS